MQFASVTCVILFMACVNHVSSVVTAEALRSDDSVAVRVTNRTDAPVLLISPARPNLQFDEEKCTVLVSTKVQESIRPYAFTPHLVELKAGETKTFTVNVQGASVAKCRAWKLAVEYAYVASEGARTVQQQDDVALRGYVLRRQQIAGN